MGLKGVQQVFESHQVEMETGVSEGSYCRHMKEGRKSGAKLGEDGESGRRGASLAGCVGEMNV